MTLLLRLHGFVKQGAAGFGELEFVEKSLQLLR